MPGAEQDAAPDTAPPAVGPTIACARIDAHAHLHPRFDAASFFDHAARNAGGTAVLCLTESAGVDRFAELLDTGAAGAWSITPTAEPESAIAARAGDTVVLIAGRQIITAERLEVLALATRAEFPDGQPLDDVLDSVRAAGAVPVLPWAFGKWWGARGKLAARALQSREGVLVGDQAGRPARARAHPMFALARARSIPVLPGSDPLNLARHVARPACYGFTLAPAGSDTFELNAHKPAADLRARLLALTSSPPSSGTRVSFAAFVRDQIALRLRPKAGGAA